MIRAPKPETLAKYGLDGPSWNAILASQGGVCAVCKQVPPSGRMVTDHEHVKGWKKKPPDERRRYVRGVLCWFCNHSYVGRGATVARMLNAAEYLRRYEDRRQVVETGSKDSRNTRRSGQARRAA